MKTPANNIQRESDDLKRFSEVGRRLVSAARKDKKFAVALMRASGYFEVVGDTQNTGTPPTVASPPLSRV